MLLYGFAHFVTVIRIITPKLRCVILCKLKVANTLLSRLA